ncbi:DUF5658 family protein [Halapricum hydrolyticum]|uniref:DUF5658 family protein n=1 Tax=Halapricum hydrolyticum TaxID=2979991 RepID=A0AAE3I988_9EURY|nr:DUF5658 family protein [Halapricum hydrolyticum]MCU4717214.1 DUF5658 family protein [Halapricum hydrolyticum]MCU4726141.1 DUF5658 family protein [Halapricum hydrolyticum]
MSIRLSSQGNHTEGDRRVVDRLAAVEPQLWIVLLVTLFADVVLTHYGLQVGLTEANPLMRTAIEAAGIVALLGVKLLIVVVGVGVRLSLDERGAVVPIGLALPWLLAATINAVLLGASFSL